MDMPTAAEMIRVLELKSHPEGGHYRETFRDLRQVEGRPASTAILYLLAHGERSHWHRIDAVEIWHYYAGAALKLLLVDGSKGKKFSGSASISMQAKFLRWPCRRALGERRRALVNGRSLAVQLHLAFRLKVLSWRLQAGRRSVKRNKTTIIAE